MDWFSWLSETGLDSSLVYEYGLLFSHNELEEDDVAHFDHHFLQSMGISIAKHRLEILKLAAKKKKNQNNKPARAAARLLEAVRTAKDCLAKCMQSLARRESSSALVLVPARTAHGGRRGSALKRSKRLVFLKHGRSLLLTDGGLKMVRPPPPPLRSHSASPMMCYKSEDGDDGFWVGAGAGGEMKWDSMFQDLKPT